MKIIIFKEQSKFVAQGLEWDICTSAETSDKVIESFKRVHYGELFLQKGFNNPIPNPAPQKFWDLWDNNVSKIVLDEKDFCFKIYE